MMNAEKPEATKRPSGDEIEDRMLDAAGAMDEGPRFPGMTYEQGVEEALRWVLGQGSDPLAD